MLNLRFASLAAALSMPVLAGCGALSGMTDQPAGQSVIRAQRLPSAGYDPLAQTHPLPLGIDNVKNLPGSEHTGRTVVAATALDAADHTVQDLLRLSGGASELSIALAEEVDSAVLYVRYDSSREHLAAGQAGSGEHVSLIHQVEPGLLAVAFAATGQAGLAANTELVRLRFAPGARNVVRSASLITTNIRARVNDIAVADNGDTSVTLQWSERHPGDYDQNGEVNAADLTRIGQQFRKAVAPGSADYARLEVIDGDGNGEINSADITVIGQNFRSFITGYNIYRTPLNAPAELPVATEAGRWVKVQNAAEPSGPSAPRQFNGQDFRLVYTFIDASGAGDFGWFVRPTGPSNNEEGTDSDVATFTVGGGTPPEAGLSFEIMPPQGGTVTPGSDIFIAVNVTGAVGLFSANVRFEYDATLLEFVEAVPSYNDGTEHPSILSPPLFVGADNVGSAETPYRLIGFNATQTLGTPAVTADGALGYVHFRSIGDGVNNSAVRFPQSTNFIYLWGEQYGVPVLTPALGEPLQIAVIP